VHCRSEQQAQALKAALEARLAQCRLQLHPTKTRIVYCKDERRKAKYPNATFDFLGYCFRPRLVKRSRDGSLFCGFNPAVSTSAMRAMQATIRQLNIRRQTQRSLSDINQLLNPLLRGWIEYYGRFAPSGAVPGASLRQSRAGGLGDAEVSSASRLTRSVRAVSSNGFPRNVRISLLTSSSE